MHRLCQSASCRLSVVASRLPQVRHLNNWKDENVQRAALEEVGKSLGVKELDDWYSVSQQKVRSKLSFILLRYNSSVYRALKTLYPHHNWDPLRFSKIPHDHWKDINNQKEALERLGEQYGVRTLDDWYSVPLTPVKKELSFIRHYYNGSVSEALKRIYPQHDWNDLLFAKTSVGYWQQASTQLHFKRLLQEWVHEHNIQSMKDWYFIPPIKQMLFRRIAKGTFGGVAKMMKEWFPTMKWNTQIHSSTAEVELQQLLHHFPDLKVHAKVDKYSMDMYIPHLNLAIEYQGKQHLQQTWRGDVQLQKLRDQSKKEFCEEQGISLIKISHLWNGSWAQLRATILQQRPDINLP